jgi:uncharacterized membrane protein
MDTEIAPSSKRDDVRINIWVSPQMRKNAKKVAKSLGLNLTSFIKLALSHQMQSYQHILESSDKPEAKEN